MDKIVLETIELFDGSTVEATTENTRYYTHLGNLAMYDHVYVNVIEGGDLYIWRNHPVFETLVAQVIENECTMILNLREVSDNDKEAFEKMIKKMSDEMSEIPDEWSEQG